LSAGLTGGGGGKCPGVAEQLRGKIGQNGLSGWWPNLIGWEKGGDFASAEMEKNCEKYAEMQENLTLCGIIAACFKGKTRSKLFGPRGGKNTTGAII